ncbi:hypothetical protein MKX01_034083 [Papaver californicum]|nr:hypothetical protein MKX01_034083 [Papaver californicum]
MICIQHLFVSGRRISQEEEEDIEIYEQLKILNKTPIKTIKMNDGEIVDCIDENKQPAFDHPLLKNHMIRSRPSSPPKHSSHGTSSRKMVKLRHLNCPKGTVPIRRTSKEDLIRVKSFTESFKPRSLIVQPNAPVVEPPGQHVAVFHSPNGTDPLEKHIFHGIKAKMTAENPSVQQNQYTASLLWLEGGTVDNANTIQAGWMVAPSLFEDNKTHVFVSWWGASGSGCYNIQCPGFVQTNKDYYVGGVLDNTSVYGGMQYYLGYMIHQDGGTGDWWFSVYGETNADIGYWPRELVHNLGTGANYIAWGGLVKNLPHEASPPMGNGHFPEGDSKKVAVKYDMHYLDENYCCYMITGGDYIEKDGFSIFFGGPGGNCN